MISEMKLSVIMPVYNEAATVAAILEKLARVPVVDEVIVVNDGSTDGSAQLLTKLKQKNNKLKVITHRKNRGYGGALISGFKTATKKLVFYTDGDGQYDVKELPILLKLMTRDVDFVNGIKMTRHDATYRIIVGNLYSLVIRWGFWLPIVDVDCDFRLIRRSIIKKTKLTNTSGSICVELVKKAQRAGARFRQVSVHHFDRRWGESQFFVPRRILKTFWDLGSLWLQLMIIDPLKK